MFGKILSIVDDNVIIENTAKKIESSIINAHVIFEFRDKKIIGEIIEMTNEIVKVVLVGELENGDFTQGIIKKPAVDSTIRMIHKDELETLLGKQDTTSKEWLYVGKSTVYDGYNVSVDINKFFNSHFAIMGNTGAGKSCSVARLLQNIFLDNNKEHPVKANICIFDVYGEYHSAFNAINVVPGVNYKNLTTKVDVVEGEIVKIPPYFLEADDIALILGVDDSTQIPIIEKALKLVYIFTENEAVVKDHKNYIIAQALLDILSSGKTSTQLRDQVLAVLSKFNTADINLESQIVQPGYTRSLRQCLNIDTTGKMNSINLVVAFLETFTKVTMKLERPETGFYYTFEDLLLALDFALISEGILKSDKVFDKANILKVRLDTLVHSNLGKYFEYDDLITKEDFVRKLFTASNNEKAQILNMNLNYIDERFAKVLTKIYSKLFFDVSVKAEQRGGFPIQIILEEAHRYVMNDTDTEIIGYNVFDRITKEGRKYGVILGLISQRPSELSNTALSQCSNFLVFRMYHPADLEIVSSLSSAVTEESIQKLKTLKPGMALGFGTAFKLTQLIRMDMPNPSPQSSSANLIDTWY